MDTTQNAPDSDESVRELVSRLTEDTAFLFRQETNLARREIEDKLAATKNDLISMSIGGAVLYAGLLTLLGAITLMLALAMALWAAALIVGLVVTAIGGALVYFGKSRLEERSAVPRESIRSVQKDAQRMQEAMR